MCIDSDFAVKPSPTAIVKVEVNIRNFARKNFPAFKLARQIIWSARVGFDLQF